MIYLATIMVLGPLVAKQSLGGAGAWAAILVAFSFGTLLGNAWSMRLRPKRPLVLLVIPDMWRITGETPAERPSVILDETLGAESEPAGAAAGSSRAT